MAVVSLGTLAAAATVDIPAEPVSTVPWLPVALGMCFVAGLVSLVAVAGLNRFAGGTPWFLKAMLVAPIAPMLMTALSILTSMMATGRGVWDTATLILPLPVRGQLLWIGMLVSGGLVAGFWARRYERSKKSKRAENIDAFK